MLIGFRPAFAPYVKSGEKCRTYREPKCLNEKNCTGYMAFSKLYSPPHCYLRCWNDMHGRPGSREPMRIAYQNRIKQGDTLHLYAGLRRREYCKTEEDWPTLGPEGSWGYCNFFIPKTRKCKNDACFLQGALLLRPDLPKCKSSRLRKWKDITEEDAWADGFRPGYQEGVCELLCGEDGFRQDRIDCSYCTSWKKMKRYFKDPEPGKLLQEIKWREKP